MTVPTRKDVKNALKANQSTPKTISKEQRHKYAYVKERAHNLEKDNNNAIIIFPDADEPWYKMGNFSALVYAFDLGRRMGKTPRVLIDEDKGTCQFDWVASLHDQENFIANMAKIGFTEKEELGDGIIRFPLKRTYTKSEIKQLYKQVDDILDELHNLIGVKKVFPKFYAQLIKVLPIYFSKLRRMNAVTREAFGIRMWQNLLKVNSIYRLVARGHLNVRDGMQEIITLLDAVIDCGTVAANVGVWDPQTATKMVKMAVELKEHAVDIVKGEARK